jgi:hypothetical protein
MTGFVPHRIFYIVIQRVSKIDHSFKQLSKRFFALNSNTIKRRLPTKV